MAGEGKESNQSAYGIDGGRGHHGCTDREAEVNHSCCFLELILCSPHALEAPWLGGFHPWRGDSVLYPPGPWVLIVLLQLPADWKHLSPTSDTQGTSPSPRTAEPTCLSVIRVTHQGRHGASA